MTGPDWTELSAAAGAAAALGALITAAVTWRIGNRQVRHAEDVNGVNLAIQIRGHVHSAEFRHARREAAAALLAGRVTLDVVYVLDELETVGLLLRRGVLDREIVWTMMSALAVNYTAAARSHIDQDRQGNPTLWSNLLYLYDQMVEVERCMGGTDVNPPATYRSYLELEVRQAAPLSGSPTDAATARLGAPPDVSDVSDGAPAGRV